MGVKFREVIKCRQRVTIPGVTPSDRGLADLNGQSFTVGFTVVLISDVPACFCATSQTSSKTCGPLVGHVSRNYTETVQTDCLPAGARCWILLPCDVKIN